MENEIKTNWDLNGYYSGLEDINLKDDLEKVKQIVDDFVSKYQAKIASLTETELVGFYEMDSQIDYLINKIAIYLHSLKSLETQNQNVLKASGEFENLMIELANKTLFISEEFKQIGNQKLLELSKHPILKDYSNSLVKKADSVQYLLDTKTEYALNLKANSGASSYDNLREEYTTSFEFEVNINGETKKITEDEVRSLRMSADENIRKEAFRSIRAVYNNPQTQIVLGNTYSAIVKDSVSDIKLRGYKNVMSPRNKDEQLPDTAVDMLILEVQNQYPLFQRFLKAKAKLMGKEKLMNWDILAPIGDTEAEYTFSEGKDLYLKVIKEFDQEFYDYSLEMFTKGRVDVFPKTGKRGGAYCMYDSGFESIVLLNYTNKLHDVSTLAHELGHAIHGHFSQNQKSQVFNTGMSLAETASIFNETILNNAIEKTLNQQDKISHLASHLNDIFSTIFRQIQYTSFERRVHEILLSGKELGYKDYNLLWREEIVKMQGDVVEYDVPAENESTWSGIPHIFSTPFYCYSYSFGNILSFSLYEMYLEKGSDFIEIYKNILKAGGSKTPYDLLIEYGIDITKPEFYRKGLKVIENMVVEFESLVK